MILSLVSFANLFHAHTIKESTLEFRLGRPGSPYGLNGIRHSLHCKLSFLYGHYWYTWNFANSSFQVFIACCHNIASVHLNPGYYTIIRIGSFMRAC